MTKRTGHTFRLVNIGRGKFCGEVTVTTPDQLIFEVCKHLASRNVSLFQDGTVCAGMHTVGTVEPVGDVARAQLVKWCGE